MTRNARIRRCLAQAPSTSHEIAFITGMTRRTVQIGLWILRRQGHVVSIREIPRPGKGRPIKLYDLTAKGRAIAASEVHGL
jgi:predicted transcriptional regulator